MNIKSRVIHEGVIYVILIIISHNIDISSECKSVFLNLYSPILLSVIKIKYTMYKSKVEFSFSIPQTP